MRKLLISIIICILLSVLVQGVTCEDVLTPGANCEMKSPYLECVGTYNYTIHNLTGLVTSGNLTSSGEGLYYFMFNLSEGDYLVKLCDDSTREINVKYEEENMWLAIVFSLGIMTCLFLVIAFAIKDKDLKHLKIFFLLLGVVNTLLLGAIPYLISLNPEDVKSFLPVGIGYLSVNGLAVVYFMWFYAAHLVGNVFRKTGGKNE